ncbi:sulfurtransferase complex subunit TusB [Stutzerimonas urumqiensis]|uniref:sulfurtransferase complex subunit TusB n=1 Tax=Stutzerimonas urumqiensis TaxID=638269 RepID=UPI003DA68927
MTTLHVVPHSPFADDRLQSCIRLLRPEDGLLLCGNAVEALRDGTKPRALLDEAAAASRNIYALDEDLAARALAGLPEWLRAVDYAGFVELSCQYQRVNGWT